MTNPEWIEEIKGRASDDQLRWRGDVIPLLQLVEKQREALERIGKLARENEIRDNQDLMAAPKGNPDNCWAPFSRHTQDLGWIADTAQEALNYKPEGRQGGRPPCST
jgi:hypothetical protein